MGYEMTNVLIYGAGAIGSFVGYLLMAPSQSNGLKIENVALLGRASHMQKIIEAGLQINLQDRSQHLQFKYCFINLNDLKESDFYPDLVIICVKTYSLQRVCFELNVSGLLQGRLRNSCFLLLRASCDRERSFSANDTLIEAVYLEKLLATFCKAV